MKAVVPVPWYNVLDAEEMMLTLVFKRRWTKGGQYLQGRLHTVAAYGTGQLQYELVEGWGQLPDGWSWGQVGGVAVDSQDHVHVFT